MWKCKCGESHEDTFDSCWSCGADRSTAVSKSDAGDLSSDAMGRKQKEKIDGDSRANASSASISLVTTRYRDAYLVARTTASIGAAVKGVSIGLGGLIPIVAIIAGSKAGSTWTFFFGGILLGIIVGLPIYLLGILVSAHGQVLKAALDTAVHTSPFLKKGDIAQVMDL